MTAAITSSGRLALIHSLLLPAMGVLYLALVYGLWTRQSWTHPLAITLFIAEPHAST